MTRLSRMLAGVAVAAAAAGALVVWAGRGDAGSDKIAFPTDFTSGVLSS